MSLINIYAFASRWLYYIMLSRNLSIGKIMLSRNLCEVYKKGLLFMSELYKRIEMLCKNENMTITTMCKEAGASRASLSDLKVGRKQSLSTETLSRIAKTLGVSVSFLLGDEMLWSAAVIRFGFCWESRFREEKKGNARAIISSPYYSEEEKFNAQIIVFKALFSRSLEASGYSLDHVDFPTYISMLLWQGKDKHRIPETVYSKFISRYGTMPGIPSGTYYTVNQGKEKTPTVSGERDILDEVDIAFYNGFKELTEEQQATIRDMVQLMRARKASQEK